ncbi:hypothetical protein OG462_15850 [Streptomyces sp. NBC_01077]|uniref:hypothetical protein n=1 Tax=Streptomyces sp. NBC_01077 TaxID=2903746 RepID=UPI0038646336|nr:hypothetical protein OG462_15850 [Streptomyces sp. NBC_01077]
MASDPGARVFASGGYIGLFDQGIRKPQQHAAKRIDEVLQTGGIFERTRRKPINKSPHASYFHGTAEPKAVSAGVAAGICEFAPFVAPGPLQTAEDFEKS